MFIARSRSTFPPGPKPVVIDVLVSIGPFSGPLNLSFMADTSTSPGLLTVAPADVIPGVTICEPYHQGSAIRKSTVNVPADRLTPVTSIWEDASPSPVCVVNPVDHKTVRCNDNCLPVGANSFFNVRRLLRYCARASPERLPLTSTPRTHIPRVMTC